LVRPYRLQLADGGVVHVLLLLAQEVRGHGVEAVAAQFVVPLYGLHEIELHAALDGDLLVVAAQFDIESKT